MGGIKGSTKAEAKAYYVLMGLTPTTPKLTLTELGKKFAVTASTIMRWRDEGQWDQELALNETRYDALVADKANKILEESADTYVTNMVQVNAKTINQLTETAELIFQLIGFHLPKSIDEYIALIERDPKQMLSLNKLATALAPLLDMRRKLGDQTYDLLRDGQKRGLDTRAEVDVNRVADESASLEERVEAIGTSKLARLIELLEERGDALSNEIIDAAFEEQEIDLEKENALSTLRNRVMASDGE
jgi:hypothetical protein